MEKITPAHKMLKIAAVLYTLFVPVALWFTLAERSADDRRRLLRVRADMRSFSGPINAYYVDSNIYPFTDGSVSTPAAPSAPAFVPVSEPAAETTPTPAEGDLLNHSYDPTNGSIQSGGDAYRVRQ